MSTSDDTTTETSETTTYVVLRHIDDHDWQVVGTVHAHGAQAAIRKHVNAGPPDQAEGTYVAVPLRSWQARTLKTTVETKQVWS